MEKVSRGSQGSQHLKCLNEASQGVRSSLQGSDSIYAASRSADANLQKVEPSLLNVYQSATPMFADTIGVPQSQIEFTKEKLSDLAKSTQRKKAADVRRLVRGFCTTVAPNDPEETEKFVLVNVCNLNHGLWTIEESEKMYGILQNVGTAYIGASKRNSKIAISSLVALHLRYETLVQFIPSLTPYMYSKARRHAKLWYPEASVDPDPQIRERYNKDKVFRFVAFIVSPHVIQDLPWGSRKIVFSCGNTETIANVVRIMNNRRIIFLYRNHLNETGNLSMDMSDNT